MANGSFDRTLKLWDLQRGINIATLQEHTSPIRSETFAPDGRMLVSSSEDGTIRLWDSRTGECLRVLTVERPYGGMNISGVTGLTDAQTEALRVLGAIAYQLVLLTTIVVVTPILSHYYWSPLVVRSIWCRVQAEIMAIANSPTTEG